MSWYDRVILPKLLNAAMKAPDMTRIRAGFVPHADGRVLEIGIGSGLNLPHYADGVHVTGIDPSEELQVYAREVAERHGREVEFVCASAESIPADNNFFDSCVVTWSLCTIPDPMATLSEVRRVLKPGGRLVFAEHGVSPDAGVAKWQDRVNPFWRKIAGGCNLNRDTVGMLSDAGFGFDELVQDYISGPKIATYTTRGVAHTL